MTVLVGLWSLCSMVRCFQARSFFFMTRSFHSFSVKLDVRAKGSIFTFFSINYVFLFVLFLLLGLKNEVYTRVTPKLFKRLIKLVLTVLWNDLTIILVERTDHSRTKSRATY